MDIVGGAASRGRNIRPLGFLFFLITAISPLNSQPSATQTPKTESRSESPLTAHIKTLYSQHRWEEIVRAVSAVTSRDADLDFYFGSALAQLGRFDDAHRVFLAGYQIAPDDKRFPIELAGVAFKQKRNKTAAAWLRSALRIDPRDEYANDFLGTVYFLAGNLEAALEYWNKIDKPWVESVQPDHPLRIRPAQSPALPHWRRRCREW